MAKQRAGIILFCVDAHGKKKYLLGNESKWIKDLIPKDKWNPAYEHVSESKCRNMAGALRYFKHQKATVQALLPDNPVHHAQIEHKDDVYSTKWMIAHEKPKWGLPKGHCEDSDKNIFACARREFHEETLSKLSGTVLDSISFPYKREDEIEFFVCEVEYDIMDAILDKFAKNLADNHGDGTEFSDLATFSQRQVKRMVAHMETNEATAIAMSKLFQRRSTRKSPGSSGSSGSSSASSKRSKTHKNKKE